MVNITKTFLFKFFYTTAFTLSLAACGFTNDKPVENQNVYKATELQTACKVDSEKLKQFTRLIIPNEISCIEKSLNQYLQLVKTKTPNTINNSELNTFIERFFSDQSKELIDALEVLFETNTLFLRDDKGEISKENLPILFDLLRETNEKIVRINLILDRLSEAKSLSLNNPKMVVRIEFEIEKFNDEIKDLSEKIIKRLESRNRPIQSVLLYRYLNETVKKLGSTTINTENIENMIFLKSLVVGGDRDIINSEEAKLIIRKLPAILDIWANINYIQKGTFKDNVTYAEFLKDNIKKVENYVIAAQKTNDDLITQKEIEFFLKKIFDKDDLEDNVENFWTIKRLILGGSKTAVTNIEATELVKKLPFIIDIWARFQDYPEKNFKSKKDYFRFLGSLVDIVNQKLIVKTLPNEPVLNASKIQKLIKQFAEKEIDLEDIELIVKFKSLATGYLGDINTFDLYQLLNKLPSTLEVVGDIIDNKPDSFKNKTEYTRFLNTKVQWLKDYFIIQNLPKSELIFLTDHDIRLIIDYILLDNKTLIDRTLTDDEFDTILNFKKLILGKDKNHLTFEEINIFLNKLPSLIEVYGSGDDLINNDYPDKTVFSLLMLQTYRKLNSLLVWNQDDFEVLTNSKIIALIKRFQSKESKTDYTRFLPSLQSIKERLIGGNKDIYKLNDLKTIFNIAQDVTEQYFYNNFMYDKFRVSFESLKTPVNVLPPPIYAEIDQLFSANRKNELFLNFKFIAETYKYQRDPVTKIQYYAYEFERNKSGFVEMGLLQFASQKLLLSYGHKASNGQFQIDIPKFEKFLVAMKPILEEFKLWSPKFQTFARNAVLLADLFQNRSDGDVEMNTVETTEYLSMILAAVEIKTKFMVEIEKVCSNVSSDPIDDPQFPEPCFKEHFFDLFLNKMKLAKSFPRLDLYVKSSPRNDYQNYLKGVAGFARDVNDPKIPINSRDVTLIVGAMLNIETTFLRFDFGKNNIINTNELNEAFKVYEDAIISVAKLKPEQKKYARSIFFYMIINMQIPKTGNWIDDASFFLFHQCLEYDICRETRLEPIEGKRLNIGMLLYYLVNL